MSIELAMLSNHLILCRPLLFWPSIFPNIRVFSNGSALHISWPEYWGFSFSISPSSAYSGLISFRIDWFDLLVVQGTLESLLQHHNSKASVLRHSAFFTVRLSHPYIILSITTWNSLYNTFPSLCPLQWFFFHLGVFCLTNRFIFVFLSSFDLYLAILTHALGAPFVSLLIKFASLLVPSFLLLAHS